MHAISPPTRSERLTLRIMILIGTLSLLYLTWRLLDRTVMGYAPFYLLLMAGVIYTHLGLLLEWYHYLAISIPAVPASAPPFSVDILTTFCAGEPYEMVVRTLKAIKAVNYPHESWLCDEADDPYLKRICAEMGIHHVTRTTHADAKAGNINNALRQARGELVVVLDPDHVPVPEFLDPIVPHFSDPRVGFVQIVQAYSNIGENRVAKGAAQQTFQFYGPMMATMNSYGTVQAIGANCTFRRTALDSIGGHAAGLSEDMHTAMRLHAAGWQSLYVPAVLTRGLVPSTLSAYYKQQLKWSRGTLDLFFKVYPRLLRRFTWRQRLHYGMLPLFYLSGVVNLINFLVPVLALFTGLMPLRMDMVQLIMLAAPTLAAVVLIRHYVQRWVMEEDERGFHVTGGLLTIGTWWIYLAGLVYTLIGKKVPYIPTPKDDSEPDDWRLHLANAAVLLLSVVAIVYGLWWDWTPFSMTMAGLAFLNAAIMTANILFTRRRAQRPARSVWRAWLHHWTQRARTGWWYFRHDHMYAFMRRLGLPLLLLVMLATWIMIRGVPSEESTLQRAPERPRLFYTGIFYPVDTNGLTDLRQVNALQQECSIHFNIISLYLAWGEAPRCQLPDSLIESIYANGSIPMITWEPWAALFARSAANEELRNERKMLAYISQGYFDDFLANFADRIRALQRPVFIRFAHECDNPAYPWSASGGNTPADYISAWRHVHDLFIRHGAFNTIWVYNPWQAKTASLYFPGEGYVDWLGATLLNYGPQNPDLGWYDLRDLYSGYREQLVFQSGLPVMIAEMGSLAAAGRQTPWWQAAFQAIAHDYKEVQAIVLFNSSQDLNILAPTAAGRLDWRLENPGPVFAAMHQHPDLRPAGAVTIAPTLTASSAANLQHQLRGRRPLPDNFRGFHYHKGEKWFRNVHSLSRLEVEADLAAIRAMGANTIHRYGPGIYDRNILRAAARQKVSIHYGFWIPTILDISRNTTTLAEVEKKILRRISELRDEPGIVAWNLGNNAWKRLAGRYFEPDLAYQRHDYLQWLRELIGKIKALDPSRPVTLDIELGTTILADLLQLQQELPQLDAAGIIIESDTTGLAELSRADFPWYYGRISASAIDKVDLRGKNALISSWQDQSGRDLATMDGVLDRLGRRKPVWFELARIWGRDIPRPEWPDIHILRPARITYPNTLLTYHALIRDSGEWRLAASLHPGWKFEWALVKSDGLGRYIAWTDLGAGPSQIVKIPPGSDNYLIHLTAVKEGLVITTVTPLQTPILWEVLHSR